MRSDNERSLRSRRKLGQLGAVWVTVFSFFLTIAPSSMASRTESSTASRFLAQPEQQLTHYTALRRMYARSEKFGQEAWLDARTELDAQGFRYEIVSERGSDYARNKVLKAVLKREQELIAQGHAERSILSRANYEFTDQKAPDDGLLYVLMKPKRKDVFLVDGRMVLTPDAMELLRVEGRLSKNPSFWTSSVNIIRHYGRVDGVRVPIATESIAKIKFAGLSRLEVHYDYESINGRPVSLSARRVMAARR
jgi:hypothetical protein